MPQITLTRDGLTRAVAASPYTSIRKLAKAYGIDYTNLHRLARTGDTPGQQTITVLLHASGLKFEDVFTLTDD